MAIAAANSLSDVYAMGGRPVTALSIVAYPEKGEPEILEEILRGLEELKTRGMEDCLQLLHFHLGSQIPNIRIVKGALNEAARIYTELVKDGALVPHGLRHEGLAPEEVETAIREHGIADVRGVRAAYLEPDGTISVIPIDVQPMRGRRRVKRVRQFRRGTG